MSTSSVCDIAEALEAIDDDRETLEVLATMLLSDLPARLECLETALVAGNGSEVVHLAHRMKGSLATFRAHTVCNQLFAIEQAAQQGDLVAASRIFKQLAPQFAQCQAELIEGRTVHFVSP